jgi:hypothetical protein
MKCEYPHDVVDRFYLFVSARNHKLATNRLDTNHKTCLSKGLYDFARAMYTSSVLLENDV